MKKGNMIRSEMNSSNQLTENVLKEYKKSVGDVVLVAISHEHPLNFLHIYPRQKEIFV